MQRLREQMRPVEPVPGVLASPITPAPLPACVGGLNGFCKEGGAQDVPEEWRECAQWYYREYAKDRGRFLEESLKDFYPAKFEQVKAYLLNTGGEDADAAMLAG